MKLSVLAMTSPTESILAIALIAAIVIIIILAIREIVAWYWKINDRIALQKQNNALLKDILEELRESNKNNTPKQDSAYLSAEDMDKPNMSEEVRSMLKMCDPGEIVIVHKESGRAEIASSDRWKSMVEYGKDKSYYKYLP